MNYEKKIILSVTLVSITLGITFSIYSNVQKKTNSLVSANIEALTREESEDEYCYKVKDSCSCKKNGEFVAMRIISCQKYKKVAGVLCQSCRVNDCPPGSSCY